MFWPLFLCVVCTRSILLASLILNWHVSGRKMTDAWNWKFDRSWPSMQFMPKNATKCKLKVYSAGIVLDGFHNQSAINVEEKVTKMIFSAELCHFFQLWWLIMNTFCVETLVSIVQPGQLCMRDPGKVICVAFTNLAKTLSLSKTTDWGLLNAKVVIV